MSCRRFVGYAGSPADSLTPRLRENQQPSPSRRHLFHSKEQIHSEQETDQACQNGEENGELGRWMKGFCVDSNPNMQKVQQRHDDHDHAEQRKTHPNEGRKRHREEKGRLLPQAQFTQQQSKALDHKAKGDRCQARAYPRQESALVGEVVRHLLAVDDWSVPFHGCLGGTLLPLLLWSHQSLLTRQSRPGALAAQDALNQHVDPSDVPGQVLWDAIAGSEVRDTGRAHPHLLIGPLPDEDFERQIKCEEWGSNHEWRASFRTAKDQHMGLLHREADAFGFCTMVNLGKEAQMSALYGRLQALQRLLHRKRTGSGYDALDRGRRCRCRWLVHGSHLSPVLTRNRFSLLITASHSHCIIPIC